LDPVLVSQAAGQLGIQIHTIALGQPGAVPFPQTNANGQPTVVYWESPLDEAVMLEIAASSHGLYGRAGEEASIRQITDSLMAVSAVPAPAPTANQVYDLYPWFIALGLMLLLMDSGLRQTYLRQLPEPV
jgi:Ca-activated chloride channel family protein